MQMISSILLLVSPWVIKWVTEGVKRLSMSNDWSVGYHAVTLRLFVALCSFGVAASMALSSHKDIDVVSVQTLAESIVVFISATGLYFWQKYKAIR